MYPKTKFGNQNRAFSAFWYEHYDWLEYSIKMDAVFCYACRIFCTNYIDDTFLLKGLKIGKN